MVTEVSPEQRPNAFLPIVVTQLQAKEKDLAEQKQMAEDAEAMKIIRKYKISSERLQMLNKLSEDEVRNLLQKREQEKEDSTNEKQEIIG